MVDWGLKQYPVKSTMSDGSKDRDSRGFEAFYYQLLSTIGTH